MASIIVLTRILSKENFGLLSFLLLAYSTVITLAQLGLPESIFYFFERVPKESRKSLALLTGKTLFIIGIGASVILIVLTFLAPLWGFNVKGLFLPLILLALLELPTIPMPNILIALDQVKEAAYLNIIASLSQFTALIVPALLGQPLSVIVFCLLGYGLIRFGLSAYLFLKNFQQEGGPLPSGMVREQFRYSIPLGFAQILWGLNRQIDKYIVAAFLPVAVYAEYVVGSWEIPLIPVIAYSVASVMMPQLVASHIKGEKDEILSLWFKAIHKVSILVLPLTVLFFLVAEEFIAVVFSENYIRAAVPFRIYTLILLQRVAAYSAMLKALGDTRAISYSAIYLVLINLVLSIPLVIWLGIAGPATATLIANIFTWGYALMKIRNALGVTLGEVFPFRFYGKTLFTSVFSAFPVLILKFYIITSNQVSLVWMPITYLFIYAFFSKITGVVKKGDWNYLAMGLKLKSNY